RYSSSKALCNETIIKSKMITNGKAEIMDAVCRASKPPDHNKTAAAPARITPQVNLISSGGFNIPFVVCIPNTNVAESADVIKKVLINTIDKTDAIVANGKSFKAPNSANSVTAP